MARTKEKTGYLNDSAAQARVQRILKTLEASPSVKRSYVVMQTLIQSLMPLQRLVALCLLIKVLLIPFDDNQLAYVMAHEIAHGEHKDIINGAKNKSAFYSCRYCSRGVVKGAALLSNVAGNYLSNQVFTMSQEKSS